MEYTYKTATEKVRIDVGEEWVAVLRDMDRRESNAERRYRRHNYSLDAVLYEGAEYGACDAYACEDDAEERRSRIGEAMGRLTDTQRRRLRFRARGMTFRAIAEAEGVDVKSAEESVKAARKKFLKFFF